MQNEDDFKILNFYEVRIAKVPSPLELIAKTKVWLIKDYEDIEMTLFICFGGLRISLTNASNPEPLGGQY